MIEETMLGIASYYLISEIFYGKSLFFKRSTPVAILMMNQQKSIVFANADMVYPLIDC